MSLFEVHVVVKYVGDVLFKFIRNGKVKNSCITILFGLCYSGLLFASEYIVNGDTIKIETVHRIQHSIDGIFMIDGKRFKVKKSCYGFKEGDQVVFLEGNSFGLCQSAKIYNKRTKRKCDVWCD